MNAYTLDELYRLAQDGNTEALVKLGLCYKLGDKVEVNPVSAAQCFYSAAKAKNPSGMYQLAVCYEQGFGLEKDENAAVYWYREAAKLFYEAARLGDPQAQYGLGNCYSEGKGVGQDQEAAIYWYQAAAQQDHVDAQYNLGYCYLFGVGVEANEVVALKWYQSAASHGDPQMQHNLGLIYKNGYGSVTRNYGKAAEWFFKAARQGYSESKAELALIYFSNPSAVKDISVAERLMTEAAEDGVLSAQIYLMHYYFDRDPSRKNMEKAYLWASKAAKETKDPTVCMVIGICCAEGELVAKDEKLAYRWLSEAGDDPSGLDKDACYFLGRFYQEGQVVKKSFEKASYYYSLAQEKGSERARKGLESLQAELKKETEEQAAAVHAEGPVEGETIFKNDDTPEESISSGNTRIFTQEELEKTRAVAPVAQSTFEKLRQQIQENQRQIGEIPKSKEFLWDEEERMLIQAYEEEAIPVSQNNNENNKNEEDPVKEDFCGEEFAEKDSAEEDYSEWEVEEDLAEESSEEEGLAKEEDLVEEDSSEEEFTEEQVSGEEYAGEELNEESPARENSAEEESPEEESDKEDSDENWEFPSGFGEQHPSERHSSEHEEDGEEIRPKRSPVVIREVEDMEDELLDYNDGKTEEPDDEPESDDYEDESPEEEEDGDWESSDDYFLASLLATGARVTNTTAATPKPKPRIESVLPKEESVLPEEPLQEEPDRNISAEGQESAQPDTGQGPDYVVPSNEEPDLDSSLNGEQDWELDFEGCVGEAYPVESANTEPLGRRLGDHIPIHEVDVDEAEDSGDFEESDLAAEPEEELPESEDQPEELPESENQPEELPESEDQPEELPESEDQPEELPESEDQPEELPELEEPQESEESEESDRPEIPTAGQSDETASEAGEDEISQALQEALKDVFRESGEIADEEAKSAEPLLPEPKEQPDEQPEEREIPKEPPRSRSSRRYEELPDDPYEPEEEFEDPEPGKIHWILIALIMLAGSIAVAAAILFATGNWPFGSEQSGFINFFAKSSSGHITGSDMAGEPVETKETKPQTEASEPQVKTKEAEESTKELTEADTEESTEATTEEPTETSTEELTETSTEEFTEASTEESTEASTEESTEASTEESTEASTEESTEASTEESTEASTEESTEASTEESTEASTEESTEASTEESTETGAEESTEDVTEGETEPERTILFVEQIPQFSGEPYQEGEIPKSGCIYAKLCSYDEKEGTVYAGKPTQMNLARVAENALGMNVIGDTVYYYAAEGEFKTVYAVSEEGGEAEAVAEHIEGNPEIFIMNNSIFANNREYEIGKDPEGIERENVQRFLTFSEEYAYYLSKDGEIARNTYDWDEEEILGIPVLTEGTLWAQILGDYLLLYCDGYGLLSFQIENGTLVRIPFSGVAACNGLPGNGNWVYGVLEGCIVRTRPNGSGLETVSIAPLEGSWGNIIHATENYVMVTIEEGPGAGDYLVNPQNNEYALIVLRQ